MSSDRQGVMVCVPSLSVDVSKRETLKLKNGEQHDGMTMLKLAWHLIKRVSQWSSGRLLAAIDWILQGGRTFKAQMLDEELQRFHVQL